MRLTPIIIARSAGAIHYFTGKPCKHGHIANRLTSNSACVDCNKVLCSAAYFSNAEIRKAKRKAAWYADRDISIATSRARYAANPEIWKSKRDRWRRENPAKFRQQSRRYCDRRAGRSIAAEGHYTDADIERLLVDQSCRCLGCRADITDAYTINHIVPLKRGGSNWPENIQLLCKSCNSSKGASLMSEWLARRALPVQQAMGI